MIETIFWTLVAVLVVRYIAEKFAPKSPAPRDYPGPSNPYRK